MAITHAAALSTRGLRVFVTVDSDATWPAHLPHGTEAVPLLRKRGSLLRSVQRIASSVRPARVHSWGAVLPRCACPSSVTIHDWGPFRDRGINLRSRGIWLSAMLTNIEFADTVHFWSPEVCRATPAMVRNLVRDKVLISRPYVTESRRTSALRSLTLPRGFCLFVGTDTPRKRLDYTAAVCFAAGIPLVAAGRGTERLGATDSILGLGRVGEEALQELYERCDALVMLSAYEGFGLPALEAASYRKPLIVTAETQRVQGLPSALIIPTHASVGLAALLLRRTWLAGLPVPGDVGPERDPALIQWLSA